MDQRFFKFGLKSKFKSHCANESSKGITLEISPFTSWQILMTLQQGGHFLKPL